MFGIKLIENADCPPDSAVLFCQATDDKGRLVCDAKGMPVLNMVKVVHLDNESRSLLVDWKA